MVRSPCCEKVGLRRRKWKKEEDQILTNYVQANREGSWRSLPKNAGAISPTVVTFFFFWVLYNEN